MLVPPEESKVVGVGSRLRNTRVDMGGVGRLYVMYIKMVCSINRECKYVLKNNKFEIA